MRIALYHSSEALMATWATNRNRRLLRTIVILLEILISIVAVSFIPTSLYGQNLALPAPGASNQQSSNATAQSKYRLCSDVHDVQKQYGFVQRDETSSRTGSAMNSRSTR
jgi:hypothetical protein